MKRKWVAPSQDKVDELVGTFDPIAKKAWEKASHKKRMAAIEDVDKPYPARTTTTLGGIICKYRRKQTGNVKQTEVRPQGTVFSLPQSSFHQYPKLQLTDDQKKMLAEDPTNDYSKVLKMLLSVDNGDLIKLAQSFPAGDIERREKVVEFGISLKAYYHLNSSVFSDIIKLKKSEVLADLYDQHSQFRPIILEMKKLVDQIQHCSEYDHAFESFSEERCWLCPEAGFQTINSMVSIRTPKLADKRFVEIKVTQLSLLNKLAQAGDPESIAQMAKIGQQREAESDTPRDGMLQTSHLCEPVHANTLGRHKRCYNPAHLIAESSQQNNRRKNCLGVVRLATGELLNVCPHGTKLINGQWINRCLGQREPSIDGELSAAQEAYLAPGVPRKTPDEQHASRSIDFPRAAPPSAQPSTQFESNLFKSAEDEQRK